MTMCRWSGVWKVYSSLKTKGCSRLFMISASVTAYLIWLFEIKNCFCIDFIAKNFPDSLCLTLYTLPNEPSPNSDNRSKSANLTDLIGTVAAWLVVRVAAVDDTELMTLSYLGLLVSYMSIDLRMDSAARIYCTYLLTSATSCFFLRSSFC
jgi:hypothetical protein